MIEQPTIAEAAAVLFEALNSPGFIRGERNRAVERRSVDLLNALDRHGFRGWRDIVGRNRNRKATDRRLNGLPYAH